MYLEEEQTSKANSLSGAFTPHPQPSSEFTVKVFLNFSVPAPCPSPQESAQSAADSASPVSSPGPSDFHPIRRLPHRKQRLPLGRPGARGPAPGVVCEWGEGRGRGGPEPCEPDASSGELRDFEALLCAPSRRAAAASGAGTHGRGLREAGETRPRPRARDPRSFGRSVTGFPERSRRAFGSKAPIGLRARITRLAETWGPSFWG